jgi:hypothetical protein
MDEVEIINNLIDIFDTSISSNSLRILIFGPGEYNVEPYSILCYNKRLQIKELLNQNGHDALLPEDLYKKANAQGIPPKNVTLFEKLLIDNHCDFAIFLYLPKCLGLEHELSTFSILPDIASKMICFYDESTTKHWTLKDRFDFILKNGGQIEEFNEEDIRICNVATKAIERAENLRRIAFYLPFIN